MLDLGCNTNMVETVAQTELGENNNLAYLRGLLEKVAKKKEQERAGDTTEQIPLAEKVSWSPGVSLKLMFILMLCGCSPQAFKQEPEANVQPPAPENISMDEVIGHSQMESQDILEAVQIPPGKWPVLQEHKVVPTDTLFDLAEKYYRGNYRQFDPHVGVMLIRIKNGLVDKPLPQGATIEIPVYFGEEYLGENPTYIPNSTTASELDESEPDSKIEATPTLAAGAANN